MGRRIAALLAVSIFGVAGVGLVWQVALSQSAPPPPPVIAPDKPATPGLPAASGSQTTPTVPTPPIGNTGAPPLIGPVPAVPDALAYPGVMSPEAYLAEREAALERRERAMAEDLKRLEVIERRIEARWNEARTLNDQATMRWQQTAAEVTTPAGRIALPSSLAERREQLALVTAITKKMKPKDAALMVAEWPLPLQADVTARLGPRTASPVLAELAPEMAARITERLAVAGPPTPIETPDEDGGTP